MGFAAGAATFFVRFADRLGDAALFGGLARKFLFRDLPVVRFAIGCAGEDCESYSNDDRAASSPLMGSPLMDADRPDW
jgi:hypothetical protein